MNAIVRAFLNRFLGDRGERAAARYLRRRGFRVLLRGYRTTRGEIDLIARDGSTLVFVEVKSRAARRARRGRHPGETAMPRLTLAALQFLKENGLLEHPSRFDVVAIVWPDGQRKPTIEHIPNAFDAVGRGQMFR